MCDYQEVIAALEVTEPRWGPGEHGYHPRTIGFLADEVVRRVAGKPLGEVFRERIAEPNEMALWIGLAAEESGKVGELVPAKASLGGEPREFYAALSRRESDTYWAFSSPRGIRGVSEMNEKKAWQAGWPAMGGVASVQGLARFYAWLMRQDFFEEMCETRAQGMDRVQQVPSAFGFGLKLEDDGWVGHPGAGGSYALCHPETGWAAAFVANSFERCLVPAEARRQLLGALGGR